METIKHILQIICCCGMLVLFCTACGQQMSGPIEGTNTVAVDTAAPSPTSEPAIEPAVTSEPVSEPTQGPTPHDWAGSGYSYTSERLSITVEFPPEWAELMTISDAQRTVGANGGEVTRDCIVLRPVHGWNDLTDDQSDGGQDYIGVIYWRNVGEWGYEASSGAMVYLAQRDGMEIVCWMPMNTKLNFDSDSINWSEYETVETGLQNGEFEVSFI